MIRAILAALVLHAAYPAAADDAGTLDVCLSQNRDNPTACYGVVADPCQQATKQTTLDIVACMGRETAAWDALLNRWYKELKAPLDEPSAEALRDAQRAWIAFRDADCAFAYTRWGDGSMRNVAGAYCQRDRTAGRAIELRDHLDYGR